MADWRPLLLEPPGLDTSRSLSGWFDRIAQRLLNGTRLLVNNEPHRLTEVEFYYHGGAHLDPFSHGEVVQRECGRWYFHRTRGMYRGGSFKGFDLTFAGPEVFGGILIRSFEKPDGTLVDGPSLCVDHLLARTQQPEVAALDRAIAGRLVWVAGSPLHLEMTEGLEGRPLFHTPRVGLSLRRWRDSELPPRFLMLPYRYLSEPRRIAKGKIHLVLALHTAGKSFLEILQLTGCPRAAAARYIDDFEQGRKLADFTPFRGIDLGPKDLCRLYGLWWEKYGSAHAAG